MTLLTLKYGMFSADNIHRIYKHDILPYADVGVRISDPSMMIWLERMFTCFGNVTGKRILDFGAASGHKALLLSKLGATVFAVDMADESIIRMKHARQISGINFKIIKGNDSYLLTIDPGTFDLILCGEVIEHIRPSKLPTFLDSMHNILSPGGKLFLTTPNFDVYGPAENSAEYFEHSPFGHYKHYSITELINLLDQASFQICNYWYECHPLTRLRNHIFYPLAQYDNALYASNRFQLIRYALRPLSWIFHLIMDGIYPISYRLQRMYEYKRSKISTGMTIMIDAEKIISNGNQPKSRLQ
tara:strand:- start:9975 stop:10877 length:903 start_codon:yes stop_codon:yes gene_type:complete